MKKLLYFLTIGLFIVSCKKEQPPTKLIGKWESRLSYVQINLGDSSTERIDTIINSNKFWIQYTKDYKLYTNRGIPICEGSFLLIRGNKFIEGYFPCHVISGVYDGKFLSKIYSLSNDTLVLEDSFEEGLSRLTLVKIN